MATRANWQLSEGTQRYLQGCDRESRLTCTGARLNLANGLGNQGGTFDRCKHLVHLNGEPHEPIMIADQVVKGERLVGTTIEDLADHGLVDIDAHVCMNGLIGH